MKTSPAQFVRQFKQEVSKITWPTRSETVQGTQSPFLICRFCYSFRAILYYMLEYFPVHLSGFWFRGTTFSYVEFPP